MSKAHKIKGKENIKDFALAGWATFTLENEETQNRCTYEVRRKRYKKEDADGNNHWHFEGPHKVRVIFEHGKKGQALGEINQDGTFKVHPYSKLKGKLADKVFGWFMTVLAAGETLPSNVGLWHNGHCGYCGKALKVPESIERGIGPVCSGKGYTHLGKDVAAKKVGPQIFAVTKFEDLEPVAEKKLAPAAELAVEMLKEAPEKLNLYGAEKVDPTPENGGWAPEPWAPEPQIKDGEVNVKTIRVTAEVLSALQALGIKYEEVAECHTWNDTK